MGSDDLPETTFETCDYCGGSFEYDVSYPVVTCRDESGDVELYSFCDEECQQAWEAECGPQAHNTD